MKPDQAKPPAETQSLGLIVGQAVKLIERSRIGEEMDEGFDCGEFGGIEHARMLGTALDKLSRQHGFEGYEHLCHAVRCRATDHWVYVNMACDADFAEWSVPVDHRAALERY